WKQDNPLNASLGYSKKGWTTGEIGVEWIKDFDNQTKAKAAGRPHLLLVDGHNSHYTRAFLSYAREANIRVLCYPAHTTHVLQGLDVVIFSSLKKAIRGERDAYERSTGDMFSKTNFLGIYGRAHIQVMKPDTIKSAFRATGVCPFDRTVITPEMMAASKETSCQGALPVVCSTPIR
ncbi:DDE-domain-containing protein, partial [Schizophyllum commune Tattone D]